MKNRSIIACSLAKTSVCLSYWPGVSSVIVWTFTRGWGNREHNQQSAGNRESIINLKIWSMSAEISTLPCRVKRQFLLSWKVSSYCLLALHGSTLLIGVVSEFYNKLHGSPWKSTILAKFISMLLNSPPCICCRLHRIVGAWYRIYNLTCWKVKLLTHNST